MIQISAKPSRLPSPAERPIHLTHSKMEKNTREIRELLLGSELIDAERARAIGLVNRVVAPPIKS